LLASAAKIDEKIEEHTMLKKLILLIALTGCLMNLAACSPYVIWKEEVKLNDGRIIVVEQKKRIVGGMDREAWLTIDLPDFSAQPIVWHENLRPLVVNIDGGRLYVVGVPPTEVEFNHYGKPRPAYIGFVWENGTWTRGSFEKIPESIYTVNMLAERFPPNGTSLLTLEKKNSRELNGDARVPDYLKRLNSKFTFD
jgi:hypothetical protein